MRRLLLPLCLLLVLGATACREAGPPATATYKVGGMDCDGCASNVQTSVGKIDGVLSVRVSYKDGRAEVTYDPGELKPGAVEAAVERMGFTAERLGS